MQLNFTPEQEAHLSRIADYPGVNTEELVTGAALRLMQEDTEFRAAVVVLHIWHGAQSRHDPPPSQPTVKVRA